MFRRSLFVGLLLLLSAAIVAAQSETCPPLIQKALDQVGDACGTLDRNTACYGNISLQAEAQSDTVDFTFTDVGDIVGLNDLHSLKTSPLDEEKNTWGVAVLSVQANLPDTIPGQNVTMMVYGDSSLEPQLNETLDVSASTTINVRQQPDTDSAIVGKLASGTTLPADGRLEDDSWVRVITAENVIGWVSLDVSTVDGDVSLLKVRAPDDTSIGGQSAFYFQSGIGRSACAELPSGGLIVQSPEGTEVELVINDVSIEVGSTVAIRFLDKVPGATVDDPELPHLAFYVLEGGIKKVALTGAIPRNVFLPTVEQGLVLYVPVNTDTGLPNGQEPLIKPYNQDDIDSLAPLAAALPVPITPSIPMSSEDFAILQTLTIEAGDWGFVASNSPITCLDTNEIQEDLAPLIPTLTRALSGALSIDENDADTLILKTAQIPIPLTLTRTAPDIFNGTSEYGELTLKLETSTLGILRVVMPVTDPAGVPFCERTEFFLIGGKAK